MLLAKIIIAIAVPFWANAKLYHIPSTLNTNPIFWQPQCVVAKVKYGDSALVQLVSIDFKPAYNWYNC